MFEGKVSLGVAINSVASIDASALPLCIASCDGTKWRFSLDMTNNQQMMGYGLWAQLRVWIDCPRCGRVDKLTRDFRLARGDAGSLLEKVDFACERCGEPATMHFERTVSAIH